MPPMPKSSKRSETLRSDDAFAVSISSGRATANGSEACFAVTTECQHEMIGFVSMRLEKDGETAREIMACKNLVDMAAIQSRWVGETIRDYSVEMTKLLTICTKFVDGRVGATG